MTNTGKRIQEIRRAVGLSGAELARRAGVPESVIFAIEVDGVEPTVPTLEAICKVLGASVEEVLGSNYTCDELSYLSRKIVRLPVRQRDAVGSLLAALEDVNKGVTPDAATFRPKRREERFEGYIHVNLGGADIEDVSEEAWDSIRELSAFHRQQCEEEEKKNANRVRQSFDSRTD